MALAHSNAAGGLTPINIQFNSGPKMFNSPQPAQASSVRLPEIIRQQNNTNTRGDFEGDDCFTIDLSSMNSINCAFWSEENSTCINGIKLSPPCFGVIDSNLDGGSVVIGDDMKTRKCNETYSVSKLLVDAAKAMHVHNESEKSSSIKCVQMLSQFVEKYHATIEKNLKCSDDTQPSKSNKKGKSSKVIKCKSLTVVLPHDCDLFTVDIFAAVARHCKLKMRNVYGSDIATVTGRLLTEPTERNPQTSSLEETFNKLSSAKRAVLLYLYATVEDDLYHLQTTLLHVDLMPDANQKNYSNGKVHFQRIAVAARHNQLGRVMNIEEILLSLTTEAKVTKVSYV
jgi:hypothetical protein